MFSDFSRYDLEEALYNVLYDMHDKNKNWIGLCDNCKKVCNYKLLKHINKKDYEHRYCKLGNVCENSFGLCMECDELCKKNNQ